MKVDARPPQPTAPASPNAPSTPAAPPVAAALGPAPAPDTFAAADKPPVSLSMPPPPVESTATEQARPAESLWYRFKKTVVLFFTGIDYDPHVHRLDDKAVEKMNEVLQPGDVILRRTDGTTSNWVIPGYWGHAAIYAGDGKILDATTHDVREIGLQDFCDEGDAAIVVRPKGVEARHVEATLEYARAQLGKPYDFDLDFEDDARFTCTEFVETSLRQGTGRSWGASDSLAISPKDFLNDRVDFVWSSLGTMVR